MPPPQAQGSVENNNGRMSHFRDSAPPNRGLRGLSLALSH